MSRESFPHNIYKSFVTDIPDEDLIAAIVTLENSCEEVGIMRENVAIRADIMGKHPLDLPEHAQLVAAFSKLSGQGVPNSITIPDAKTRILRAKLILEEALETIEAMGVSVSVVEDLLDYPVEFDRLMFQDIGQDKVNLVEVVDGCLDTRVVTTGTLIAFGVPDTYALQNIVDTNNILKFRTDKDGYRREDGKWVKPSDHPAPKVADFLKLYGWKE